LTLSTGYDKLYGSRIESNTDVLGDIDGFIDRKAKPLSTQKNYFEIVAIRMKKLFKQRRKYNFS